MSARYHSKNISIPGDQSAFTLTRLSATPSSSSRGITFNQVPCESTTPNSTGGSNTIQSQKSPPISTMTPDDLMAARTIQQLGSGGKGIDPPPPLDYFKPQGASMGTPQERINSWTYCKDSPFSSPDVVQQARRKLNLEAGGLKGRAAQFKTPTPVKSGANAAKRKRTDSSALACGSSGVLTPKTEPKGSSPVCSTSSMIGSNSASRYDSSLLKLTKNFLHLVQYCPEGVINLNEAAESLGVQKRRLYDITNVLEGIDLVEKMGKNSIRWKVTPQQASTYGVTARSLEEENEDLDKKEKHLDDMIGQLQNAIKLATEDPTEQPYAYVKYDDLRSVPGFSDHTVFAIKAPADSCLEVPDPRETGKLQMLIKSQNGQQVEVFLCPENSPTAHSALSLPSSSSNTSAQSSTSSHLYTPIDAQASCSSENLHMSGEFANLHTTADGSTYLLEDGLTGDCKPWHQPPPHTVALGQSEAILPSTSQADKSVFFGSLELPDSPLKPLLLSEAQLKTPVNHPSSHLQPLTTAASAFVQLQPPQEENYQFALDYAEGLSDLFLDSYNSSLSDQSGGSLSNSVTMSY